MPLDAGTVQFVQIDFQEKLYAAMPAEERELAAKNAENLLFLAGELGAPITITEQYPQGLGPTLRQLHAVEALEKMTFSAMGERAFADRLHRRRLVLWGIEAHICVLLTLEALRAQDYDVIVAQDACLSRRTSARDLAMARARELGAAVLPTETVLFSLLGAAGTPLFKEISRRIR